MIPEESRFESDPAEVLGDGPGLPPGWTVGTPDPSDPGDLARLTALLRDHELHGRGWAGSDQDDVLVEVADDGLRTRENVVVRDSGGVIHAWGSVHDRAGGRMLFIHIVDRALPAGAAAACSEALFEWAVAQAEAVGSARGLDVQQIDTGAFADDERQARWLEGAGFERVRHWWQMTRPVTPDEADRVPSTEQWEADGVRFRLVRRGPDGMPDTDDLREVHDVLEEAFRDHFNSWEETFDEFVHRLREDPGHRWDHWWVAELVDDPGRPQPVGALVGTEATSADGPGGSYVSYIGVLGAARGRGVGKGLLTTIIADAARRGRNRVTLEVDADSPTGATSLYTGMGWRTSYVTESWHRAVPVPRGS